MNTALDWFEVVLLAAWLVVTIVGLISNAKEQNALRNEIELLNERMDRQGMPDRLPVHVITDAGPAADADGDTTVLPVVGRHRIERREATADAALVDVRG